MADWRDFPLPDGSYSDDCRPFTQQDVCNYLPTFAEATGTRSRTKYVPVPGLVTLAGVGNGPHRGIRDVEGKLFVVSGNTLYQVATDGTATSRGTIPGTRRVSMVHNQIDGGNELIIATGDNSYVWNTVTETLTATGVPLLFVDFLNQLIIGIDVARRFWRWSGLADATSWNSLDNESAESSPDRLVGQIVSQGEVLLFGERTIEVWSNSPSGNLTFQRSTVIEKGCANGNTICRLDNTVYFVGNDSIAYRLENGYTPVPISSKAITDSISDGDPSKLFAFTWEDKGYVVYYLTAQDGNTWGFDVTCQKFHRRESFGLTRWRVNTLCKWNGDWYAGDYSNGKLYRLEWGNVYEGCEIMPRTLRTGVMHNNGNRMFVSALKLLVNTGHEPSVSSDAPTITGDLPDGAVGVSYSYQFTITPAYPGQTVTVSAVLPTGLSIDSTGLVTGTPTTEFSEFAWSVTATTDCGDTDASGTVDIGQLVPFGCITNGFWLKADEDAGTMTKDPASDHYYMWVDSCNAYEFTTVGYDGEFADKSSGPTTGSINGIRAAFYDPSDADCTGSQPRAGGASEAAIDAVMTGTTTGFIAAIWRKDSADAVVGDRRVLYFSVEVPGNGNLERFGLTASGSTEPDGVRARARQDYLDSPNSAYSETDNAAEVVIAVAVANWSTGIISLYVNGSATPETAVIPNASGASDANVTSKTFIGSQDGGTITSNLHIGEIISQGLPTELSTADRQQIEGYLAWKWRGDSSDTDTVALLPADHPYKLAPPIL